MIFLPIHMPPELIWPGAQQMLSTLTNPSLQHIPLELVWPASQQIPPELIWSVAQQIPFILIRPSAVQQIPSALS